MCVSQSACVCARAQAYLFIFLCAYSNSVYVFLPIRHSMTGHVVKQLAGLFMHQQLWEKILKIPSGYTHTHFYTNSAQQFQMLSV